MTIMKTLSIGAAASCCALAVLTWAARPAEPAALRDWARDQVQTGLGYYIDSYYFDADPRRRPGTVDGWDTSSDKGKMFAGADSIEVVVTHEPAVVPTSKAGEWRLDVPVYIQASINHEMRTYQGIVHMTAVQLPETAQTPFRVTNMQLDPDRLLRAGLPAAAPAPATSPAAARG